MEKETESELGPRSRDPVREAVEGGALAVAWDISPQDLPRAATPFGRAACPPDHGIALFMVAAKFG